jgi:hypothetical protein
MTENMRNALKGVGGAFSIPFHFNHRPQASDFHSY